MRVGAKGVHSFSESITYGQLPSPSSIEHEGTFHMYQLIQGLIYDYYWETVEENEKLFKANFTSAVSKDPFSGNFTCNIPYASKGVPEYYIGMGMTGKLDGGFFLLFS